jgi:hypothetical protein
MTFYRLVIPTLSKKEVSVTNSLIEWPSKPLLLPQAVVFFLGK